MILFFVIISFLLEIFKVRKFGMGFFAGYFLDFFGCCWKPLGFFFLGGGVDFCPHACRIRNETQKRHPCVSLEGKKKRKKAVDLNCIILYFSSGTCLVRKKKERKRKMAVILILFSEQLLSNFLGKVQ